MRDTKHDARVFSLLDMYLALNPGKGKSAEERREMDRRYTKGEGVMPKVKKMEGRTEEERRADEEERRLIEEVRRVSLREATERAASAAAADGARQGRGRGSRSRAGSEVRGERDGAGRRRARSATLRVEGEGGEGRGTRDGARSEERRGRGRDGEGRQVEHQSSLRNLIGGEGMEARDIEKEIEEFARQIQEEGLLDGLDLDNLDLENNDELSRRITEAYRRRHRERRRDGGRRSNASAHSHRSDVSGRPRSRTDDSSRPTSRHTARSRAPSAGGSGGEERGRYPPSSSAHLEVQEPSRRRRTASSGRSATLPVVPTQPDVRVGSRSQTDLTTRAGASESPITRPSIAGDARSSSSPATASAPVLRGDPLVDRPLPFSARAAAGLGIVQQPPETSSTLPGSRQRSDRPAPLDIRPESPTLGAHSAPISPALNSPPLTSPRRPQLPRYKEPLIHCSTCSKEHIEYELHFNCSICHGGEWNICLDCWRRRKGCLHWFGFGAAAWSRWEKHNLHHPPTPPPHMLTANRYLPPKTIPGGAEGRRVLTTENPLDRLQSGTFCCSCSAWTNSCYWRCDVCNDGEWGFCTDCVNQGKSCTHPLLALAYHAPSANPSNLNTNPNLPSSSSSSPSTPSHPLSPSNNTNTTATPIGNFHPVAHTPPCSACGVPIPQSDPHHHCYSCPSGFASPSPEENAIPKQGGYNLCSPCYASFVASGSIAPENGPAGWRRCPVGHRMVVVGFVSNHNNHNNNNNNNNNTGDRHGGGNGYLRRVVLRDLVGGRRLRFEDWRPREQVCWWREDGGSGRRVERLFAADVRVVTNPAGSGGEGAAGRWTRTFPPDGGSGWRAVAGWGWVPGPGGEDELMFPKGAEVLEVEDVNGEWFHGFYMGQQGLFPAPYVRVVSR